MFVVVFQEALVVVPLRGYYERGYSRVCRDEVVLQLLDRKKIFSLVIIDTRILLRTCFLRLTYKLYEKLYDGKTQNIETKVWE